MAYEIIKIYTGNTFSNNELKKIIRISYKKFHSNNVVKFSRLKKFNLVELYHGPTLAFKDIAMQVIGNMYEVILSKSKNRINLDSIYGERLVATRMPGKIMFTMFKTNEPRTRVPMPKEPADIIKQKSFEFW